ncbi:DUF937 domain-containing protein [Rhodobacteraceae bacterium KMM 6894]|nr:DUF937 domain-containing protein [Rhodobacteraceae bacterium KMM 6894]
MSIMKLLQQAQGGQGLSELANQFGLDQGTAEKLTQMLAPAIGSAAKQRAQSGGLNDILGTLRGEGQAEMFENASVAASDKGRSQGQAFLSSLLGGQEQADGLAQEAAQRTGVEPGIVQQFLPAIAAMAQGGLQKRMPDTSIDAIAPAGAQGAGGLMGLVGGLMGGAKSDASGGFDLGMLNDLLDADGDGSALDDVLGKFMR